MVPTALNIVVTPKHAAVLILDLLHEGEKPD